MTVEDIGNLFLMVLAKVDGDWLAMVMVTRYIYIYIYILGKWENVENYDLIMGNVNTCPKGIGLWTIFRNIFMGMAN